MTRELLFSFKFYRVIFRRYSMSSSESSGSVNVTSMRSAYRNRDEVFDIDKMEDKSPVTIFKNWFSEACKDTQIIEPNAMALATSTLDGKPSLRMVLLKGFGDDGFKFYTNYTSRKGQELESNPEAYLLFYWPSVNRQIRIEGKVEKLSGEESKDYFSERPRSSQISCYASDQSQPVSSKSELEQRRTKVEELFEDKPVEKPLNWGGYILVPRLFEFWQGQTDRFHDRIQFRHCVPSENIDDSLTKCAGDGWYYERLCP